MPALTPAGVHAREKRPPAGRFSFRAGPACRPWAATILACALWAIAGAALAQDPALGRWRTIDDATGQPRSVVEIFDAGNGTRAARVLRVLDPADPAPRCTRCTGTRHDQPVVGMVIAWDLRPDGARLAGGSILDPDNGKVYAVRMTPVDGGRRLEVRGYLGISLLGRTQVWMREP